MPGLEIPKGYIFPRLRVARIMSGILYLSGEGEEKALFRKSAKKKQLIRLPVSGGGGGNITE
jgi:hypothetical protein